MRTRFAAIGVILLTASLAAPLPIIAGQSPARPPVPSMPVQKIRDGVYRIGKIEVDTNRKEATVPASVNAGVTTLEFVANTPNGAKSYESALTVQADAYQFNTAMMLIGMDPAHARVPVRHFDPVPPAGDPVDVFVSWTINGAARRVRVEELLFDERINAPLSEGPWVYTGSAFSSGQFMAGLDGVLIGFVHSPSPIIENPRAGAVSAYGSVVLNTRLGLAGGTPVTLTIRALPVKSKNPR